MTGAVIRSFTVHTTGVEPLSFLTLRVTKRVGWFEAVAGDPLPWLGDCSLSLKQEVLAFSLCGCFLDVCGSGILSEACPCVPGNTVVCSDRTHLLLGTLLL